MNTIEKEDARRQIISMGKILINKNLVAGSWGNISVRLDKDTFAVTPSGRSYEALQPEDIVILKNDCSVVEGAAVPSSESGLHAAIYESYPEAGAVIHTHSIYASALAAMRCPVPAIIEDIVQIIGSEVRCAEYALPGTDELAANAVRALGGKKAVLLANHGAVCWGCNLEDALMVSVILEKAAQIAVICKSCGGAVELSEEDNRVMHDFYEEHYHKRQLNET